MTLITVPKAAELVGSTHQRIYNAIKRGELVPVPDLPVKVLRSEDVEAWAKLPASKGGRPRKQADEEKQTEE